MKTSLTKLKSNFFIIFSLVVLPTAWARPVAQVTELSGKVFVITPDGKTLSLKTQDHLEDKSEIMVGEGGAITLIDYYDATYHMIEGSHLKFFNKSVQLKKGKVWIRSEQKKEPLALTTANGHVDFLHSEFIATFDQSSSRSQFLVVNGEAEVSNILDKNMNYTVTAGTFTVVDPEIENGLPRTPTKIGLSSLNDSLSEFKRLPRTLKEQEATPARTIASEEDPSSTLKKGEILFISEGKMMGRFPASTAGTAHRYFKKKISKKKISKKKVIKKKSDLTNAPIRYVGTPQVPRPEVVMPRAPASVAIKIFPALPKKVEADLNMDQEFQDSLRKEIANQPKHSNELENLIQDLKSY